MYGGWPEEHPFPGDPLDAESLHIDPMTGLENLFGCLRRLHEELEEQPRGCAAPAPYLMLADIDGLAEINRSAGRLAGDEILLVARATLMDVSAREDWVFRFSRDEFAVLGHGSPDEAEALVEEAVHSFARRAREISAAEPPASLSVGLATGDTHTLPSVGGLISTANAALHQSKRRRPGSTTVLKVPRLSPDNGESPAAELLTLFSRRILDTLSIAVDAGEMALTDSLTGLPNHRAAVLHMRKHLPDLLAGGVPVSLLLADGDWLKQYNECFGYAAGNQMIADLSRILADDKRKKDFLARWFVGDEFLLVLPGADSSAAGRAAERLRRSVQRATADWPIPVTISVGTATAPDDGQHLWQLVHRAQEACAEAKRRGKNCVVRGGDIS